MMQDMMKEDLKCLNAGGQMCSVDRKCYQNLGEMDYDDAVDACERLPGGSLIAAGPTDNSIVFNCWDMEVNDDAWVVTVDGGPNCDRYTALNIFSSESCNANNFVVCEISI